MKKIFAIVALSTSFFTMSSAIVLAHELGSHDGIGAVLHLDPDDRPIAGQPSAVSLEFSDDPGFSFTDCDCKITVESTVDRAAEPVSYQMQVINANTLGATITFPAPGEYELTFSGESISGDSKFPELDLRYDVQVGETLADTVADTSSAPFYAIAVMTFIVLFAGSYQLWNWMHAVHPEVKGVPIPKD